MSKGLAPIDALQLSATYLQVRPGVLPEATAHPFGQLSGEQLDHAREHRIDVWAYTPLLAGAYDNPDKQIPEAYDHLGSTRRLAALEDVAQQTGASRGQVVLAWLVAQGIRPMLGGSKLHQLEAALDATAMTLTDDQLKQLDVR
jgi:aryl-alcohol dehydrogenase-like predicted oxidoreductase